ncbi:hypothetical protein [Lentzea jiangxiensis]|uniref:Resolvase, N terminal domain n=1 Tax=Lentzea jiangxiensis TaxID=641025 RepID=A0A1H0WU92_9PSEU|nr:hypothetical protein [Lentzea jiangxiensis]SDP94005.1 hypothetical protein SAMN05421507_1238 [Lentzea jiangxiensis]
MTTSIDAEDREPGHLSFARQVAAYVRGSDPIQRAFERRAVANFCRTKGYDVVRVIEDDCAQHTTDECHTLSTLVCLLYDKSCDVVVPRLDHLSTDPKVQDVMVRRLEATGNLVLVLPLDHGFSESGA